MCSNLGITKFAEAPGFAKLITSLQSDGLGFPVPVYSVHVWEAWFFGNTIIHPQCIDCSYAL